MGNPRLDAGGAIAVDGLAFGRAVKSTLKFGKKLGGLLFLSGGNQRQQLFLGTPSGIHQSAIHLATTQGGAGLFGGRGGVGHKDKQCPKRRGSVNP